MAWIESHQGLERHPKTFQLCSSMGWDVDTAIGKLHRLWWWCLEYAPDGNISRHSADIVAKAIDISADAGGDKFINALFSAGFIDKTVKNQFLIHDWWEYAGRYLRDTKYKNHPDKIQQIKELYAGIISRKSADDQPKRGRKSAVPTNQPTNQNTTSAFQPTEVPYRLSGKFFSLILLQNPKSRLWVLSEPEIEKKVQSWAGDFDLLVREDKQDPHYIAKVMRFAAEDDFWGPNVQSGKKLRKQWDVLVAKMERQGKSAQPAPRAPLDAAGRELRVIPKGE